MKKMFSQLLGWLSNTTKAIMACLPGIVAEVEQAAKDGKITPEERKQIAMDSVQAVCDKMNFKLNFISRWAISWAIDELCKKIPPASINVPDVVNKTIAERGVAINIPVSANSNTGDLNEKSKES
jgi:hypothetical protein